MERRSIHQGQQTPSVIIWQYTIHCYNACAAFCSTTITYATAKAVRGIARLQASECACICCAAHGVYDTWDRVMVHLISTRDWHCLAAQAEILFQGKDDNRNVERHDWQTQDNRANNCGGKRFNKTSSMPTPLQKSSTSPLGQSPNFF
eukprot:CAMPEP_0119335030 /NCGR_PEP_ID=MMETSP1333-20130426/88536_1 /TAXON_ID=418940 /ORGANISM="Scyphosphaera apsteinii, Strain RCC1455" /LENGTH=147 /DNA_ID=CAMNT_0007345479 /DNA_START=722 /DNA_END=1163 /DNA_ORIENTATION=-